MLAVINDDLSSVLFYKNNEQYDEYEKFSLRTYKKIL